MLILAALFKHNKQQLFSTDSTDSSDCYRYFWAYPFLLFSSFFYFEFLVPCGRLSFWRADLGFYKGGCPIHLKGAPEVERRRQGWGQSIMFGGLEPRAWRARAYNRGLGAEPPLGSRGRAPGQGQSHPEAENLIASGCATEAANLPHSVRTLTGPTPLLPRLP